MDLKDLQEIDKKANIYVQVPLKDWKAIQKEFAKIDALKNNAVIALTKGLNEDGIKEIYLNYGDYHLDDYKILQEAYDNLMENPKYVKTSVEIIDKESLEPLIKNISLFSDGKSSEVQTAIKIWKERYQKKADEVKRLQEQIEVLEKEKVALRSSIIEHQKEGFFSKLFK